MSHNNFCFRTQQ